MTRGLDESGGACLEGILMILIGAFVKRETRKRGVLPMVVLTLFGIARSGIIVVDDDLVRLPVALSWGKHDSAGFL